MVLYLSYSKGPEWIPIPRNLLRKLQQKPLTGGKYLQKVLADGKVETFPQADKYLVGDIVDEFLREREFIKKGQYVLVEESCHHRDEES